MPSTTQTSRITTEPLVLGRDAVGIVAEADGTRYYLTECCLASAKGFSDCTGCRACCTEIDPRLGGIPDGDLRYVNGRLEFVAKPLALIEIFGDGIPYAEFAATRRATR